MKSQSRYACSDSQMIKGSQPFMSKCQDHTHLETSGKCRYCNLIPQVIQEMLDMVEYVHTKGYIEDIDFEEMSYEVEKAEENIVEYKKMLKRNYLQSLDWEQFFKKQDKFIVMVTSDWAMVSTLIKMKLQVTFILCSSIFDKYQFLSSIS